MKGLLWEGDGFLLLYKRLDNGCFRWPRNEIEARKLTTQQIRWLMEGLDIEQLRMWVYCTDKIKLYQYTQTRNGENAVSFLNGYTGYLVCDGYDGYNKLKNITRCACWAHARRKFYEALPADEEIRKTSRANEGFERINKIFALEREYASLSPEERHTKR